jgi:hypothetical protein
VPVSVPRSRTTAPPVPPARPDNPRKRALTRRHRVAHPGKVARMSTTKTKRPDLAASNEPLLPVGDLAAERGLTVTPQTLRNWAAGRVDFPPLETITVGGRMRSTRSAFRAWLAAVRAQERSRAAN